MTRIPEDIGVYTSMLDMAICRGDTSLAKLAFRAISSLPNAKEVLSFVLIGASMSHFSILPMEVINLDMNTVWDTVSAMCEADLDKRALSLYLIRNLDPKDPLAVDLNRWANLHKEGKRVLGSTYGLIQIHEVVSYLRREIRDTDYFLYGGIPIGEVDNINSIPPIYYLGKHSWLRHHIINSLQMYPPNINYVSDLIELFELNRTGKIIQYELDYWRPAKECYIRALTKDTLTEVENRWNNILKPKAEQIIETILMERLPIPMNG